MHRGLPAADRTGGRPGARLPQGGPRWGAGPRGRDRRPPQGRRAARPPGGPAGGGQGRALHDRHADDLRLADAGALPAAIRRRGRPPAAGRRRRDRRQDEHGRVRHGRLERELRIRRSAQPLGSDPRPGWVERRLGGLRGGRHGPGGDRLRHWRLDPAAGGPVRDHRPEADLRHGQPPRPDRLRIEPRSDRADGQIRRRLRPGDGDDRRPRRR